MRLRFLFCHKKSHYSKTNIKETQTNYFDDDDDEDICDTRDGKDGDDDNDLYRFFKMPKSKYLRRLRCHVVVGENKKTKKKINALY